MATITSAQSGYWNDPATWAGGSVPDLSVDDVVIADYHTVTADGSSSLTLAGGRSITVETYGVLELGTPMTVSSGASVYVLGGLAVYAGLEILGYFQVYAGGWLDTCGGVAILYGGSLDAGGGVHVNPYAYFDVLYGSSLYVGGWFSQDWNAYSTVYQGSHVDVASGGSAFFDGNLNVEDYSALHVYSDAEFSYGSSVNVSYGSGLYVEPGGSLLVRNYLNLVDSGCLYVHGDLTLDGCLYAYNGSQTCVEYGGTFTINGYLNVDNYSTLTVYGGNLTLSRWAGLEASYESTVYFDYLSRTDLFGYFRLYSDAWLYLGWDAVVRVYRDVNISGRMNSGGGKFVMLRREGRINDADGESLFVFDQAYGFEPHLVA